MPRSTSKVVVFARHASGKGHTTYPVSIHANEKTASAFRAKIAAAHKSGDADAVKALSPAVRTDESGKLFPDTRWAIVEVPYEPEVPIEDSAEDNFEF
jgi:hypothetical protein